MSTGQITEHSVTTGAINLHVAMTEPSDIPALVLLHGLYDRWDVWQPLVHQLDGNFHVIAPDLRGHARSDHPDSGYELSDYAGDIAALLDSLDVSSATVAGHSLGALVALAVAADLPDRIENLVMIDPPLRQSEQGLQLLEILLEARRSDPVATYSIISELYAFSGTESDWRRQSEWLRSTSEAALEAMITMSDGASAEYMLSMMERVHCPTLFIQADPMSGGALSDADAAEAMQRLASGVHVQITDAGHSLHQDNPEAIAREIWSLTGLR